MPHDTMKKLTKMWENPKANVSQIINNEKEKETNSIHRLLMISFVIVLV